MLLESTIKISTSSLDTHEPPLNSHRRVGQVPLPPADGQLHSQVLHDSVGEAKVAFTVLKVDGVDLVRHRGGSHLSGNGALPVD